VGCHTLRSRSMPTCRQAGRQATGRQVTGRRAGGWRWAGRRASLQQRQMLTIVQVALTYVSTLQRPGTSPADACTWHTSQRVHSSPGLPYQHAHHSSPSPCGSPAGAASRRGSAASPGTAAHHSAAPQHLPGWWRPRHATGAGHCHPQQRNPATCSGGQGVTISPHHQFCNATLLWRRCAQSHVPHKWVRPSA